MKTSILLRDDTLREAIAATGVKEKTALIHMGLEELINKAARERLKRLGGLAPKAAAGRRRRSA